MKQDFKELVLKNAKEIFIKFGYSKTTMNDIAKACFKSKGLIYHHFKSKEEILTIIISREMTGIISAIKHEVNQCDDAGDKLKKFIYSFLNYSTDTKNLYHKLIVEFDEFYIHVEKTINEFKININEILMEIIEWGDKNNCFRLNDTHEIHKGIMILLAGYMKPHFHVVEKRLFDNPEIDTIVDIISNGILK